ncbi:uncharacterized protein JCM6883_003047 [Sporobolomyces salmoneus]|uniref:uncharacterized protein n=1 Tax=Sporobolomyces salmoneus TaxID=183962 RepID=UPI0031755275
MSEDIWFAEIQSRIVFPPASRARLPGRIQQLKSVTRNAMSSANLRKLSLVPFTSSHLPPSSHALSFPTRRDSKQPHAHSTSLTYTPSATRFTATDIKQSSSSTEFALDPSLFPDHQQPRIDSLASIANESSTIRERERNQLRVVAQSLVHSIHPPSLTSLRRRLNLVRESLSLAPQLVLDQSISVPNAPPTLRHCLAPSAPLLPISVLRACLNEASTNALFSSATSLDASQEETTRLLNEVDSFQSTVLGLLDEVERRYTAEGNRGKGGKNGLKREADDIQDVQPTKVKKYMLHRGGANGGDLFTSAAFLSDRDLEQVSLLNDADLVAVHPPSASSSSALAPPAPSLGSVYPALPPTPTYLPVSVRYNLTPGQSPALAPLLPALIPPPAPRTNSISSTSFVRETRMLDYGVWSSGSPKWDSMGSTDGGYYRAATRIVGRERVKKWEKGLIPSEPLPRLQLDDVASPSTTTGQDLVLSKEERRTLEEMEIEIEGFLNFTKRAQEDESRVWKVLERNLELIKRLGEAQVGRTRKSVKKEEKRRKAELKKSASAALPNGVEAGEEDAKDKEEERRDLAEGVEKEDADTLLESFTSLLSSFYNSSLLPSTSTANRAPPPLLPPPSLIRSLTPLIVSELHRESSYYGAFEPVTAHELKAGGWEKAVKENSGASNGGGGGGAMIKQE